MDEANVAEAEKSVQRNDDSPKSSNELKEELAELLQHLEKCQAKFIQLNQEEEIRRMQETFLQKQAYDLNESITVERLKLDEIRHRTEAHVEDFVCKINYEIEKNKYAFEANAGIAEDMRRERMREECRREYFHLKGKLEALMVFKEYQECVVNEIHKLNNAFLEQ